MSDSVIKEFLVSVGVEGSDVDKFGKLVDDATKFVVRLGEAAAVMAAGIAAATAKMASDFDKLYWQTKNLGASAGDIRALGYAFSQLGGSAGDANSALSSIANFRMAYGNGANGFLARLGVDPADLNDTVKVFTDLEHIFQKMTADGNPNSLAKANAIAGVLGLSPDQLRIMLRDNGQFEDQLKAFAERMGINFDQATKSSNDFMTQIRLLHAEFDLWADSYGIQIIEGLEPQLEALQKFVQDMVSGKQLTGLGGQFQMIVKDVEKLIDALGDLADSDAGQRFVEKTLSSLDYAIRGFTQMVKIVNDISNGNWKQALKDGQVGIADPGVRASGATNAFEAGGNALFNSMSAYRDSQVGSLPDRAATSANSLAALKYFEDQGLDDAHARGIVAMLFSESHLDPNAVNPTSGARGIAEWLSKDRLADLKKMFGHDLQFSTFNEQLRFVQHELTHRYRGVWAQMQRAGDAMSVAAIGIHGYEAPGAGEGGDFRRAASFLGGRSGPVFNQTNHLYATGADPDKVSTELAHKQDQVNQSMVSTASVWQF